MSQTKYFNHSKAGGHQDQHRIHRKSTISQPCRQSPDDGSSGRHSSRSSVISDHDARLCAGGNQSMCSPNQDHHVEQTSNFNCTQSSRQKFDKLSERSASLNKEVNRILRCKMCPRTYKDTQIYNEHLKTHKPEDLACKDCGKVFNQFRNLSAHMRTHTGDLPFQCEHCGKAFAQLRNLKTHKRYHTSEKPYPCDQCDKSFRSVSIMKDHKKWHADSSYVPYSERRNKTYSDSMDKHS